MPVPAVRLMLVTVPTFDVYPAGLLAGYAPKFVRAVAASVAPVPPLATARVPPSVRVPEAVIGPPVNERPVVPPLALTLVTVPAPAIVCHCGSSVPLDTRTWPTRPGLVKANFVPVEYTTAPATGESASPVPPRPKGSAPWVWVVSDRFTAGWTWSPRDTATDVPADAIPSADGVVAEKLAASVMLLASEPPPVRPLPAVIVRDVGTKPVTSSATVLALVTRPLLSTVRTGMAEPEP